MKVNKQPIKVLVIESYYLLKDTLVDFFHFEGFEVYHAANGEEGLKLAKEYLPDLILCARMFPDINCWEVFQELRRDESTKNIPFIFLSSKPSGILHQQLESIDSTIILTKPFSIEELINSIRICLFAGNA